MTYRRSSSRELARAGVHPPEVMPFFHAWTDEPYSEDWVVAFHEAARSTWTPNSWNLMLGTWAEGDLMGTQGAESGAWLATHTAETGSWLGRRYQGRGYGTEMRLHASPRSSATAASERTRSPRAGHR